VTTWYHNWMDFPKKRKIIANWFATKWRFMLNLIDKHCIFMDATTWTYIKH